MSSAPRPLPPAFEYVHPLGAGAFGDVVLARQRSLGRLVAIKRIHSFVLNDGEALDRFRREAVVLARLRSPVIIAVYDFTVDAGGGLLVMEYVDGAPLDEYLALEGLPAESALRILGDVADALETAAHAGIAHRDVKPANVIVSRDGRAKLGDFGLARVLTDSAVFRTAGGAVAGTPAYLPPEVSRGSEPDHWADVYSFAVMAFEVLTGRRPYTAPNGIAMIAAHWQQPVPRAESVLPGFPRAAADILERAMSKDPAHRPALRTIMDELRAVPIGEWPRPLPVDRDGATGASTRLQPPQPTVPRLSARSAPARRRRRARTALISILLFATATSATVVIARAVSSDPTLAVRSVTLAVRPRSGTCPATRFVITARIRTNGAPGRIRLAWSGPTASASTTQAIDARPDPVTAVHPVTVSGENDLLADVRVTAHAGGRTLRAAVAIDYRC